MVFLIFTLCTLTIYGFVMLIIATLYRVSYFSTLPITLGKLQYHTSDESIASSLLVKCCLDDCIAKQFTMADLRNVRDNYHSKNEIEKSNWLIEKFKLFDGDIEGWKFVFKGKRICRGAFAQLYGT